MTVKAPKFAEYSHDPQAILDYPFDWADWLTIDDVIVTATVIATDIFDSAGVAVAPEDDPTPVVVTLVTFTDTTVIAWVSGGTLGNTYLLVCHIVSADGREEDKTARLVCQEH